LLRLLRGCSARIGQLRWWSQYLVLGGMLCCVRCWRTGRDGSRCERGLHVLVLCACVDLLLLLLLPPAHGCPLVGFVSVGRIAHPHSLLLLHPPLTKHPDLRAVTLYGRRRRCVA